MPTLLESFDAAATAVTKREVVERAQKLLDETTPLGWTALMFASRDGDLGRVQMLLKMGASKGKVAANGDTAMSVAAQGLKNGPAGWGYIAAVRMLVRAVIIHDGDMAAAKADTRQGEDCPYDALCD